MLAGSRYKGKNMKNVRSKSRRKRQKRHVSRYRRSMLAVGAVIILLMAVVSVNAISLREKDRAYRAQEIELKKQIEEEKERSAEIVLDSSRLWRSVVEEVAKDKLGLVNENEIIFRAK